MVRVGVLLKLWGESLSRGGRRRNMIRLCTGSRGFNSGYQVGRLLSFTNGRNRPEADATQFSALIVIALEIRERATSPLFKSVTNPSIPLSRHFSFSIAYSLFDSHQVIEHPRSARMPSTEMKTTQPHHHVRHTAHGDYGIPGCSWQ